MEIIEYKNAYKQDFIDLNIDWIKRFFVPEEADYEVLNQIESLLDSGSMIYFALEDNHVLATCMAMPLGDDVWEICKLAAAGQSTGKGAGSAVFKASMDYAIEHGAKEAHTDFKQDTETGPAHLSKYGFKEVPLNKDYWGFERADIEFEYIPRFD